MINFYKVFSPFTMILNEKIREENVANWKLNSSLLSTFWGKTKRNMKGKLGT
jgi:hypothetical protein